jgi:hypothetical protein
VDKGFILQVDGPTHYLHAPEAVPVLTQKTLFRNALLNFSKPVVCVDYFKWDAYVTDVEKAEYLSLLLSKINIKLENKWEKPKSSGSPFWEKPSTKDNKKELLSTKSAKSPRFSLQGKH